jgi:hypothetical protein
MVSIEHKDAKFNKNKKTVNGFPVKQATSKGAI